MLLEVDLAPFWPHILCLIIVLLSIPQVYKRATQFGVYLFALVYRINSWAGEHIICCWRQRRSLEEKEQERQFKLSTPQEVAEKLKEESEYCNISGYVTFKWGFPFIFRTRHLQLYKTTILIRDADEMKKYNKQRLIRQQEQEDQLHDMIQTKDGAIITSRTFQPPKPLMIFDLSQGKAVNSRLPMTLKLVSTKSDTCYLQFSDKASYAYWCKACTKNLHIELTEKWKGDARQMLSNMQHNENIQRLEQSTPVKKRPILTTSTPKR